MNKSFTIGNKIVGDGCPTYIIAEMSANHLQSLERAKAIILAAKNAGANAIKLQTFRPDTITIDCYGPEFMATKGSIWEGQNLYSLYKKAFLPWEWHKELYSYAKELDITIFSSPFDSTAVDLLEELNTPAYKIASYEILDIPLIRKVASTGKPIILSTGIATLSDIERALNVCREEHNENVAVLKCVSEYPTPYDEINLNTIPNMGETIDCIVGLSDHSMGSAVDVAAVALGAKIIEKHLTLNRNDGGPDSAFSMEPSEFCFMVNDIRNVERALGKCTYELSKKQKLCRNNSRSIYVVKDIKKGMTFDESNIKSIRPGYGLHTWHYYDIVGKKAKADIKKGTPLSWDLIDNK